MAFLFGTPCRPSIELDGIDARKHVEIHKGSTSTRVPLYIGNETVSGKVTLTMKPGKKMDHQGVKVELIGRIEMFYDRGNHYQFVAEKKDLEPAGVLNENKEYQFAFKGVEKQYESYNGINVRLRYFLKVTVQRGFSSNATCEQDLWVHNYQKHPEINNSIKMEVGIEDCLHIEFEYNRSKYHLKDVIIGKIYFLLVRINIKHMELAIIKRESTGSGPNLYNESETITKFEIMDGAPVRGESIPIRLFLAPFELTPTYRHVHSKFSLKYYLNLVLIDDEDRRYFKQQEFALWRKRPGKDDGKKGGKKSYGQYERPSKKDGKKKKKSREEKEARRAARKAKKAAEEAERAAAEENHQSDSDDDVADNEVEEVEYVEEVVTDDEDIDEEVEYVEEVVTDDDEDVEYIEVEEEVTDDEEYEEGSDDGQID